MPSPHQRPAETYCNTLHNHMVAASTHLIALHLTVDVKEYTLQVKRELTLQRAALLYSSIGKAETFICSIILSWW